MDSSGRLEKALSVENLEAIRYYSGITYTYLQFTKVFEPHLPIKKIQPGLEAREDGKPSKASATLESSNDVFEGSLARTKSKIRDYVGCNVFELFVTFTFKADRQDIDRCKQKMNDWLKNQQKRSGRFGYLIVPEHHKKCDPCAQAHLKLCPHDDIPKPIHFHALFKNYPGRVIRAINRKNGMELVKRGREVFDIPSYTIGHAEAYKIPIDPDNQRRTGNYLGKYITKDMPRFFGKNRYWASHGLDLPHRKYGLPEWYMAKSVESIWSKDTKYGRVAYYLNSSLPVREEET